MVHQLPNLTARMTEPEMIHHVAQALQQNLTRNTPVSHGTAVDCPIVKNSRKYVPSP
jgi:hypothetical protein